MVSGWSDVPLNKEGRLNASVAARRLKALGITSITSSDTPRALQTAEIVGKFVGIPVVETERLRSWHMGALEGMHHEAADPFLAFFEKNPDVRVPDGERFRTFYNRFRDTFSNFTAYVKKFPAATPLVVTHSQNLDLIPWLIKGIEPGRELEFGSGIQPGGILKVSVEDGQITVHKVRV